MLAIVDPAEAYSGGPPVLKGSDPGSLVLLPNHISAYEAARQAPEVSAQSWLLANGNIAQALLGAASDEPRPMASTTKIMTALLALENARLDEQVVVSPNAIVGESSMGLVPGEVLTVEDLLWGLLLNSGNDAAMALAEHIAGDEEGFVALMNGRAAQLGLSNTRFVNPHGLDAPGHLSSAYDLSRITEAALAYPKFREIVATQAHTAAGHQLWNRNLLLTTYPGADGVKTGTSEAARECLVGSVTQDGHQAVVVILGSEDRYGDAQELLDHYFTHYRWAPMPVPAGPLSWIRGGDGRALRITVPEPPSILLPAWQWSMLRAQPVIAQSIPADVSEPGRTYQWYLGTTLLASAPAVISEY